MTETIEQRVRRLEEIEAIRDLHRTYIFAIDRRDWDTVGDLFTVDAELEITGLDARSPTSGEVYRGRDSIVSDFYAPSVTAGPEAGHPHYSGHCATNLQISLTGAAASASSYHLQITSDTQILAGTYQHRFRLTEAGWKITFLQIDIRYHARVVAEEVGGRPLADVRQAFADHG